MKHFTKSFTQVLITASRKAAKTGPSSVMHTLELLCHTQKRGGRTKSAHMPPHL